MSVTLDRPATASGAGSASAGRVRSLTALAGTAVGAVLVLLVAAVLSVLVGSQTISPTATVDVADPEHAVAMARVSRTLLALSVGAALGLAGACLQGLTRNPLADPGILGINAGASFAIVLGLSVLGVSDLSAYLWLALAGAAAAAVLVHLVASLGPGGATPFALVVSGAALTAALSSWTSAVLLSDRRTMETFRFWQVGTVGGRGTEMLLTGLPFLVGGALLALVSVRSLDALALGDDLARGLGRHLVVDRLALGLAVTLLAGTATALAGPIGFVGLMVPHAVRALVGVAAARVLPFSAAAGAVLLVLADTAGRVVLPPAEVQVGIMTAVLGVPALLVLVRRGAAR